MYTEALHAEGASDVRAMLCFLDQLAAIWAQLNVFSASGLVVEAVYVLFTRLAMMPRSFQKGAELEVAGWAAYLVFSCWNKRLAPRIRADCPFPWLLLEPLVLSQ